MRASFLSIFIALIIGQTGAFNCTASDVRAGLPSLICEPGEQCVEVETFEFPGMTEGNSVCYLREVEEDGLNFTLQYRVTIESVTYTYSVRDEYKFVIPQLDSTCTCQCTKGVVATDCPDNDRCTDDDVNCVEWNTVSDNREGCFVKDIHVEQIAGRSRICCKILLHSDETFTTYEITKKNPTVSVRVKTSVLLHGSDHVLYTNTHRFANSGGSATDEDLDAVITLTSIGAFDKEHLGTRYYNSEHDDTVLVTDTLINSIDEKEVDKIGWLRVGENGEFLLRRKKFKNHYNATAQDCAESELTTTFTGTYGSAPKYQTLQSKYSTTISSARRNTEGKIEVNYLSSVIKTTLQQTKQDFVLHTDVVSKVTNFTAVLHMDKNSNRKLILSLNNTSGLLKGNLTAGNKSEIFRLLLDEGTTEHIHPGIAVECVENYTTLCLEAIWRANDDLSGKCSAVKCFTIDLDAPTEMNSTIDHDVGDKDSILNPRSWLKFANPAEWFNGVNSAAEGFIIAVVVILIIILLAVIICILRCLCCFYNCCRCCKCKKRNRNSYNMNGQEVFHGPTEL